MTTIMKIEETVVGSVALCVGAMIFFAVPWGIYKIGVIRWPPAHIMEWIFVIIPAVIAFVFPFAGVLLLVVAIRGLWYGSYYLAHDASTLTWYREKHGQKSQQIVLPLSDIATVEVVEERVRSQGQGVPGFVDRSVLIHLRDGRQFEIPADFDLERNHRRIVKAIQNLRPEVVVNQHEVNAG